MSDFKKLPRELPPMEYEFSIDVQGEIIPKRYTGNFKYQIPNLKAKCSADKMRAQLNAGLEGMLDPSVTDLHFMVSYLKYSLIETPKWWVEADYGYNLHDYKVVKKVFDTVEAYEKEYLKIAWGEEKSESGEQKTE